MTLRVEHEGKSYTLSLVGERYSIAREDSPDAIAGGTATLVETMPGTYSVLFDSGTSVLVDVSALEVVVSDPRDRRAAATEADVNGSREVRSQMPGKIIKVLVAEGQTIEAGAGLLIIEAMKMQNESKSPKTGTVRRVAVKEGAAVAAGDLLVVVE